MKRDSVDVRLAADLYDSVTKSGNGRGWLYDQLTAALAQAREEGRREGLEQAAVYLETLTGEILKTATADDLGTTITDFMGGVFGKVVELIRANDLAIIKDGEPVPAISKTETAAEPERKGSGE